MARRKNSTPRDAVIISMR